MKYIIIIKNTSTFWKMLLIWNFTTSKQSDNDHPGGCFTNVSRALQNNLVKIHNTGKHIYGENFKLKLCTWAQSHALGSRTKFKLEIPVRSTISAIHKFRENILCSLWNGMGWVELWGFLWWAPSAKMKDHHGVSSGWSSVWHRSNAGLSSTQYEQIPIILGVWPFWLTPFFFRLITFWRAYG